MKCFKLLWTLTILVIASQNAFAQGVTTSSMQGKVMDTNNEPLIGANVVAVHQPSGTMYGTATDVDGNYRIANMRVGGPYKVTISYTGYGEQVLENVFLRLGETFSQDFNLDESALELATIQVSAASGIAGQNAGASTQITSEEIEVLPTLNRDLNDYLRLTPQSGAYSGGTTIAGINNRYNAIYIDGAVNNDVFGLASSGTNGGQTGISPFSIDIIDQIQVVISPYDVTLGGFAGGGINAVTKSGTNEFKGTAYYFRQDQSLAGKTNGILADRLSIDRTKLADFSQNLYGASLGGPIVKDKVFFFANAEIQNDETPIPFNLEQYKGNTNTEQQLNDLRNFLRNTYNYDPGSFLSTADELKGLKLFGKLDINLGQNHKLTLRHQYTKAEQYDRFGGNSNTINFSNNGVYFPSITNSSAIELNSRFSNTFSNNLILGYTTVRDDRDPIGGNFPYVYIEDGGNNVLRLGSEEFSTANALDQNIFTLTDNFKWYLGDHTFTIGTHNEFYHIYNLFIGQNYGTYRFADLQTFLSGGQAKEYDRAYSLVDEKTGDGSAAAAEFNAMQLGLYVQDEWQLSRNFTLTGGLRLDLPIITSDPATDTYFNNTALPVLQGQYDVAKNIEAGKAPDGQLMFSPRLGFNYNATSQTTLRGGLGIFTSRIPFVWPGAMFNNNGLTLGRVDERNITGGVDFISDINKQYVNESFAIPSGQIDIFTKDFKYPQVFRTNLALDQELPGGIVATLEGIYTKTLNNVVYTQINSDPTIAFTWEGTPDDRTVFVNKNLDNTYSAVYVASNTNEGNAYNLTASLSKRFDFGLSAYLAYNYNDAEAINEGTSSQNSSQWRGQVHINGRNNPVLGRSDFALGHRVVGALSYKLNWTEDQAFATTFSLFYNGQSGNAYSYVIGGSGGRNLNGERGSTSANRSLVYIPASQSDINLVDYTTASGQTVTAAQQWEELNAFIESDDYLNEHRGVYAEKNASYAPFSGIFDFAIRQDLGLKVGGSVQKLQLSLDVFNLANLLNKNWGVVYNVPGSQFNNYELYQFEGYKANGQGQNRIPTFTYRGGTSTGKDAFDIAGTASRWRMRLGVRYIFN